VSTLPRTQFARRLRPFWTAAAAVFALALAAGCENPAEVALRRENNELQATVRTKNDQLVAQKASLDELHEQLRIARSISEDDLKKLFYPEQLVIDKLTGGEDYDGKPGDDGVTVFLRPIDKDGDVIKVAGDIRIQLFDLAAPPQENYIGEYYVPVEQAGKLWHGKFLTDHFTIKCPWPRDPPKHAEITVRATFVDYLTKRVVSAQTTCKVKLPPD
jgi:hypothetical protein